MSPFSAWESFYVIVGSSAAALTGLQFVVIALAAEAKALRTPEVAAFGTPTIVHFCATLVVAAILSAPWRQQGYQPVLEDWLWHTVFPLASYATLLIAASVLENNPAGWLFGVAAAALFLLFIGIHNAWDAVTYIAARREH